MKASPAEYGLAREVKAVAVGAHAFAESDGTYTVRSLSRPGKKHHVIPATEGSQYFFTCDCTSGVVRRYLPVPCWASAVVGRRLEREGRARWFNGSWYSTEPQEESLDFDPDEFPHVAEVAG